MLFQDMLKFAINSKHLGRRKKKHDKTTFPPKKNGKITELQEFACYLVNWKTSKICHKESAKNCWEISDENAYVFLG